MLGCALFFVKRLESFNACPHLAADVEVSLFLSLNEREMFTCSRLEIPHSLWCRGWGIFCQSKTSGRARRTSSIRHSIYWESHLSLW